MRSHRPYLIWAAIVVPVWITLILCTHWEPVTGDGWGHLNWHRLFPTTLTNLWTFAKGSYVHNNPRLGQVLTLLVFTPGPWHVIATPIVELAMFYLLTAVALGRWPSLRSESDALVFVTVLAMVAATAPAFGPMLFYRPFTGNYLFGFVINLALLVPYRFQLETPRSERLWLAPVMLVIGFAAGLCNEHTGPAITLLAAAATAACWRRGERPKAWMVAGIIGMIAGGAALFFAPGQDVRYNGLATQQSMLERIADRGVLGNGKIVVTLLLYLLPLLVWIALGVIARRRGRPEPLSRPRVWSAIAGSAAALAIVLTLLLSPKVGERLYLASTALVCAAVASWVVPQWTQRWSRTAGAAIAAAVLAFVGWRCLHAYRIVGPEFAERLEAIQHGAPGTTVVVPHYSLKRSRWVRGDDFDADTKRTEVAREFGLAAIELAPGKSQREATPPSDEP